MAKREDQKAARRVQEATGSSYQACLQEIRRRVAVRWSHYDGTFKQFIEAEVDDLIAAWRPK